MRTCASVFITAVVAVAASRELLGQGPAERILRLNEAERKLDLSLKLDRARIFQEKPST